MQLDPILGLAARAIQAVVDPLGRADIEARDDEPDVEMLFRQQFRRDLRDTASRLYGRRGTISKQ
jgi:hypothetical protein